MARGKILALGAAVAGGAGYYLYGAGGDAKAAEKNFEHDLQVARDKATASGRQLQTEAEKYGTQANAQANAAYAKVSEEYNKVSAKAAEEYSKASASARGAIKDASEQANKSIDAFDKKVEEAAAKGKSSWSSWFGGK